jgi:hypothetical protein
MWVLCHGSFGEGEKEAYAVVMMAGAAESPVQFNLVRDQISWICFACAMEAAIAFRGRERKQIALR